MRYNLHGNVQSWDARVSHGNGLSDIYVCKLERRCNRDSAVLHRYHAI